MKSICNLCKVIHIYIQYFLRLGISKLTTDTYILLDVLLCSIAEYFYELCRILTSP